MYNHTRISTYFRQRDRGWMLSLFALVCLVYLPFLGNPFIFDDLNVIQPAYFERLSNGGFQIGLRWFPYASLSWTYHVFGETLPHYYHLGNLLLHAASVITLFYLLKEIVLAAIPGSKNDNYVIWGAWFGAAIFALHPVAVYAVGYVVERSIVMATLFVLLMQLCYLRGLLTGRKRWLVLAVLAYYFASLSKEHSLLAPALLVAQNILFRVQSRASKPALWISWGALLLIALQIILLAKGVFGVPYEIMASNLFSQQQLNASPAVLHMLSVMTQAGLFFKYLWLWLLPNPAWMSIDMREPFVATLGAWQGWLGALGFVLYGLVAFRLLLARERLGLLGLALLYPWVMFGVEFTSVRVQETFVLYRSYLWVPGLLLLIPMLLLKCRGKKTWFTFGLLALLLLGLAWNRLWVFADNYRLWNEAALLLKNERVPGADRIFYNRAVAASPDKKPGETIADLKRAIQLSPDLAPLHFVLGVEYFNAIHYPEAVSEFEEAIKLEPKNGQLYYALGLTLKRQHKDEQAMQQMKISCEFKNPAACVISGMLNTKK
jgi:tetratricopeptide (TPR) repeat protein